MALVLSGSIDISGSMTATTILISSPGAAGMVSSSAQITELAPLMAYTASLKGAIEVSGQNVNVLGMITAQQFNVTYVSSSVMYQSGSNKFGNSGDDKHEFTGSVDVNGAATFSGNVGIAVTPSAWNSNYKAINIGSAGFIYGRTDSDQTAIGINWYRDFAGAYLYKSNGFATYYEQSGGTHVWRTAPSGTAGNAITFTQAMTLFSDGNLLLTNSTVSNAGYKLDVNGTGRFTGIVTFGSTGGSGLRVYGGSGTNQWDVYLNSTNLRFSDNTGTGSVVFDRPISGTSATFSSSVTATSESFITSGDGAGKMLKFTGGTTKHNFMIAVQQNVNNALEITPSTTAGGSTFSTPALTIASTGAATFSDNIVIGTSGKGIDFSATANGSGTTSSELLNDYEEGTFTPIYTGVNLTINTYGNRAGFYTKVGRLVTVTLSIMTESVSVTGSEVVRIGGLPFTSTNTAESVSAANIFDSSRWTSLPPICGQVNVNSTQIELYSDRGATGAGTDPTTVKTGDMATGAGNRNMVRVTATYFV